jgi:hypothetical protein
VTELGKAGFALAAEIRRAVEVATGPEEAITAKTRHGKPYRRGGVVWSGVVQTATLSAENAELVRNDPHILVQAG